VSFRSPLDWLFPFPLVSFTTYKVIFGYWTQNLRKSKVSLDESSYFLPDRVPGTRFGLVRIYLNA
jgi:hypothetical protein